MKGFRITIAAFAVLTVSGACDKGDKTPAPSQSQEAIMPGTQMIPIALISNYGFMGQMMSKGDGRSFSSFYSDSAIFAREGQEVLTGVNAIRDFVRNGDEWGVIEWTRISEGFRVDGRDVIDSGTYVFNTAQVLPPNSIDPAGRYRTHWTYTPAGEWRILSDSLIRVVKKK